MDKKNELLIRVYLVFGAFVVFALLIVARVVKISVFEGDKWVKQNGVNVKWIDIEPERGNIYDVQGNILATSIPFFEIRMDLLSPTDENFNKNIDSLAYCLSRAFPKKSTSKWRKELVDDRHLGKKGKKAGTKYHLIAKNVSIEVKEALQKFPLFRLGKHKGGLIAIRENKRFHPYQELGERTVGMDRSNASKIGLEGEYNKILQGNVEKMLMQKIGPNIWVPVVDPSEISTKKGDDLVSTLNVNIQDLVEGALMRGLKKNKAKAGTAVLMDVKTGAIKAMANLGIGKDSSYTEDYNYAIARLSEPGSTFKLATSIALLENNQVELNSTANLNGGKKYFYDLPMFDSSPHGKFETTFAEIFAMSSNIGMADLAMKHYGKKDHWINFFDNLNSIGVMGQTKIDLEGESDPVFKHPLRDKKSWYGTTVPWMAHGYECMMTPLQTLNLYNAVANGGKMMRPYLGHAILSEGKLAKQFKPQVLNESIASIETLNEVRKLLKTAVWDGTGRSVQSDLVSISGKTGTTKVNYNSKDEKSKYNASFAGYFPSDNPVYSLIVMVYEPTNGKFYGGSVAGPIFKEIAEKVITVDEHLMKGEDDLALNKTIKNEYAGYAGDYKELFAYVGVTPVSTVKDRWVEVKPEATGLKVERKKIYKSKVPNVTGMGLRDATYVLENLGLNVKPHGFGKVSKQSLAPGTKIEQDWIEIYLK